MDDLKLFSSTKQHLHDLLACVGRFSTDICMKFGLNKCKVSSMIRGKWIEHAGYEVSKDQGFISGMDEGEKYKYLGYLQARGIDHKIAKQTTSATYLGRLRSILKSNLSARNKAKAVNSYATSAIEYSFGIIKWTSTDLNNLNIRTRKEFRRNRSHHPRSAIERFHLARKHGGRGIPDLVARHHRQLLHMREYFYAKANTSALHHAIVRADVKITPLKLADRSLDLAAEIPTPEQQIQTWKSKPLHGKYVATLESTYIDKSASTAYLRSGNLFSETEGFIAAIQDQVIATKAYRRRILKERLQDIKCRMCGEKEEYIDHIIAGCSVLAPKAYLDRHNRVAKILHQRLREKYMGLTDLVPYYKYEPPPICEDETCLLYWNRKILTDRPVANNIPDIVLNLKKEKVTYVIDVAVPLPMNISKTHSEKISKYIPLADEIRKMWGVSKVTVIPIIIGATGEIPNALHKSISDLGLETDLYVLMQKSVVLDTCSIVRRVLGGDET